MRAGHLPPAEDNGVSYLKVPVNVIGRRGTSTAFVAHGWHSAAEPAT